MPLIISKILRQDDREELAQTWAKGTVKAQPLPSTSSRGKWIDSGEVAIQFGVLNKSVIPIFNSPYNGNFLTMEIVAMLFHRFMHTYMWNTAFKKTLSYSFTLLLERYRFDVFCRLMVFVIVLHEKKLDYIEGVSSHQRDQKKEKMWIKKVGIGWRTELQPKFYEILFS